MPVLPTRPLLLDETYLRKVTRRSWIAFALFLVMGGGFGALGVSLVRDCLEERALWARGVPGELRSISGEVEETGRLGVTLFYEYKLDVEYADAQGGLHRGKSKFDLFWSKFAGNLRAAKVHYDPVQPDRFVLSSPIEAGLPRWGTSIAMAALSALGLFMMVMAPLTQSRTMRGFQVCAEDGEEILAPLRSVRVQSRNHYVTFQLPGRDKPQTTVLDQAPLVVTQNGAQQVVVLRSPREPERLTVVRESLAPFALDPETKARLLAQALGQRT